jgi:hypothetical protein
MFSEQARLGKEMVVAYFLIREWDFSEIIEEYTNKYSHIGGTLF